MHSLTKTYTLPPSKMNPCVGSFDRSFLPYQKFGGYRGMTVFTSIDSFYKTTGCRLLLVEPVVIKTRNVFQMA